jgi:hypothetical protein
MPRYPFTPELLDALPEELCELFRGLELQLLEEICSRLKIADQLNEVTVQDIRALRAHGIDLEDIKAAIAEATGTGADKLEALLDDVVERNQAYYTSVIDLAQVTAPERLVNEADIAAIRRQTWGAYKNITGSMGFLVVQAGRLTMLPPARAYQWALDSAELQIQSGAVSYNQAIAGQIKQLADRGLCVALDKNGNPVKNVVKYEKGGIQQLDVCVRRAVMTGVNQLNQKYREQSMDYLETDLVEVTAHLGARNVDGPNGWENHAAWQGKVYRWKRGGGGYTVPERQAAPTPPAPVRQETPAIPAPKSAEPRRTAAVDVTQEYLDAATPNSHIVQDLLSYTVNGVTYTVDGHNVQLCYSQHEKNIAELLERTLGGELFMVPRVNTPQGVRTPDYLFRGEAYDLKTLKPDAGPNTIFNRVKKASGQANRFIIDVTRSGLDDATIAEQIEKLFTRSDTAWLEELFVIRGDAIRIIKRA